MDIHINVIVRDNSGEVLATISAPKMYIINLDVAEISAALRATCSILIDDTRSALNCLQQWRVSNVQRNGNEAAHRLTKEALMLKDEHILLDETPFVCWILHLLSIVLNCFIYWDAWLFGKRKMKLHLLSLFVGRGQITRLRGRILWIIGEPCLGVLSRKLQGGMTNQRSFLFFYDPLSFNLSRLPKQISWCNYGPPKISLGIKNQLVGLEIACQALEQRETCDCE